MGWIQNLKPQTANWSRQQQLAWSALVISAIVFAGLALRGPSDVIPAAAPNIQSGNPCRSERGQITDSGTCSPVAASRADRKTISELLTAMGSSNRHVTEANSTGEAGHGDIIRDDNQSVQTGGPELPGYGYTLAELCFSADAKNDHYCQQGRYAEFSQEFHAESKNNRKENNAADKKISGRVLSPEGYGLKGVQVTATIEGAAEMGHSGTLRFKTLTDALGAYTLDGLPAGEYTLRSSRHGEYRSARIAVRAGVDYADLVLSRDTSRVVKGQVLGPGGEPLEGVMVLPVLLGQPSVLSDENGHFQLPVTLQDNNRSFAMRFQRPGFQEYRQAIRLGANTVTDDSFVRVRMQPVESWTTLSGTVLSDTGEPLPGREIELRPVIANRAYKAITDHQGRYEFPFVETQVDYQLIVFGGAEHKDFQQALRLTDDVPDKEIVVESYEFASMTGQLVNLDGIPVPDFELVLRNSGSRRPNTLVSTDEDGNFAVPKVPAGQIVVASQSTPSMLVRGLQIDPGHRMHLPLVLDWGEHELRGVVVDSRGNPVAASRIVLQWSHEADGVMTTATRRTAADMQGQFSFSKLGPGPHRLKVDAPGYPPVNINHDLSRQGYDLTVRLN